MTVGTNRVLRMPEACAFVGLSESTIRNRINKESRWYDPRMPRPIRLGGGERRGAIGFELQQLQKYIDACREQA